MNDLALTDLAIAALLAVAWWLLSRTAEHGQAMVEFALVAPVLLFALLGLGELGVLTATRYGWQDDLDTHVGWIAQHPGSEPSGVTDWTACGAAPAVTVTADVVTGTVTCRYGSRVFPGLFDGLPVSVDASAPLLVHMGAGSCGTVPSLVGLTADVAAHVLTASGFPSGGLGGSWVVRSQSHAAGQPEPCYRLIGAFG